MSKKNNVNPDHYKTAGRERQGEDIVHDVYKRKFTQSKPQTVDRHPNFIPGAQRAGETSGEEPLPIPVDLNKGSGKA